MRCRFCSTVLLLAAVVPACAQEPFSEGAPRSVTRRTDEDRSRLPDGAIHVRQRRLHGVRDALRRGRNLRRRGIPEAIQGREAIRALSAGWPAPALELEHREEWVVIDGNRLVFGWNERLGGAPAYRGISTFLFNEDGLITSYEGMFDTAAMAAATAP